MVRLVLAIPLMLLVGAVVIPAFADTGVMPVVSGKTFQVNYNTNGVKIVGMQTNPTYDELTVSVQVSAQNALLELTIPRSLLDSKQGNNDIPFITVVDGTLTNAAEQNPTLTTRTVSVQLSPGNQQVEIIGTYVAVSGPSGTSVPPLPPVSTPPSQTTQPPAAPQTPPPPQKTSSPTPSEPQTSPVAGNVTVQKNMTQNFSFTIPYLKNASITLSNVDLAVLGAISLVVIIVIASAARRTKKTSGKNF